MARPATIAHILPYLGLGGTELGTLRLAQGLDPTRFRSVMFYRRDAIPDLPRRLAEAGVETVAYDAVQPSYHRPGPFLRAARVLRRELLERGVDLVHCADILAAHYCSIGAKMARLPILCHVRTRQQHISLRDQTFLLPVDRFAFVSGDTWRAFGHRVRPAKGAVLYDGIAVDALPDLSTAAAIKAQVVAEFGFPQKALLVGMVSRVAPAKDFETLIRAAGTVIANRSNVRFLAIGSYEDAPATRAYHERLMGMISEADLGGIFLFTGFRRDVARFLTALDVVVLSTHQEGLPLVILEAMAHAKPVIATAVGGIPEIVLDGDTGLLHPHEDHQALARQITALLADPVLADRLGQSGRTHVETHFSQAAFVSSVERLYTSMLQVRGHSNT